MEVGSAVEGGRPREGTEGGELRVRGGGIRRRGEGGECRESRCCQFFTDDDVDDDEERTRSDGASGGLGKLHLWALKCSSRPH